MINQEVMRRRITDAIVSSMLKLCDSLQEKIDQKQIPNEVDLNNFCTIVKEIISSMESESCLRRNITRQLQKPSKEELEYIRVVREAVVAAFDKGLREYS